MITVTHDHMSADVTRHQWYPHVPLMPTTSDGCEGSCWLLAVGAFPQTCQIYSQSHDVEKASLLFHLSTFRIDSMFIHSSDIWASIFGLSCDYDVGLSNDTSQELCE